MQVFLGQKKDWKVRKFLDRVVRLLSNSTITEENDGSLDKVYNETVKTLPSAWITCCLIQQFLN